jgi:hypothetical protein
MVTLMAFFELVNLSSGNLAGDYESESEAMLDVLARVARYGPGAAAAIGLVSVDDKGRRTILAEGEELVARSEADAANGLKASAVLAGASITRAVQTAACFSPSRSHRVQTLGPDWASSSSSSGPLVRIPPAEVSG